MKTIWYFVFGISALVVLTLGIGYWFYLPHLDGKYDNNNALVNPSQMDLERVKASVVHIRAVAHYKDEHGKEYMDDRFIGGVVVSRRYILSVAHGVSKNDEVDVETPEGSVTIPAKVVSRVFLLMDRKRRPFASVHAVYVNHEKDIAFYELSEKLYMEPFPYAIGNSDELKEGNFVYIAGYSLGRGVNIRDGIVSALRMQGKTASNPDLKPEDFFMVNTGIVPDDSGTPIIAVRDGKFELVGIASSTNIPFSELGVAVRMNEVRKTVEACIVCPEELKRVFGPRKVDPTLLLVK